MRNFLLTYIRPVLKKIELYSVAHRLFFLIYTLKVTLVNFLTRLTKKTAVIVLYHRVGNVSADPLFLNVDRETFEEHLNFYQKFYEVVSLPELNTRLTEGLISGRELAITFDDGYVDNLSQALPILEKHNLPATIFVTTSQLGEKAHHPWDKQYLEQDRACFVSEDQLKSLSNHPLITIGAHTHTHPRLSSQTPAQQDYDIKTGKTILESITGKTINYFAYPFGGIYDINSASIAAVQKFGFHFAYLNDQKFTTGASSKFTIPRFNIRSYSVTKLALKLITLPYFWWKLKDNIGLLKAKYENTSWKLKLSHVRKEHALTAVAPCYWIYDTLTKDSIVVDVGTGYTADFSLALIDKFGVKSIGIDPTKKHSHHLAEIADTVPNFSYYQYALGVNMKNYTFLRTHTAKVVQSSTPT
ncbi:MAG: polysaccharide deacetylase family protein [Candidatus Paceibacterota bacterium]